MKVKAQGIAWTLIFLGLATLLGMKLYAQYRPVEIFVSREAPMPEELAEGLHMKEHRISPVITITSSYSKAENKIISVEEIAKIRSSLSWSVRIPIFIDTLIIHSTNHVSTQRTTSRFLEECEVVKEGEKWVIKSGTKTELADKSTVK